MGTISQNTIAENVVSNEVEVDGLYQYEFEIFELRISATDSVTFRPALREFFTESVSLSINDASAVKQKFVFADTAASSIGDLNVSYEFEGLTTELQQQFPMLPVGPLSVNSIGEIQWEGPQNFQPGLIELTIDAVDNIIKTFIRPSTLSLDITATDNQGPGFVRPEDGKTEYPHFRPSLNVIVSDTGSLNLSALDGPATAYGFPSVGIDRLEREPGLPIGPITISTISEEQYEGLQNFQPGLVELTIDEPSPIAVRINYPVDTGSLEIGVNEVVVFRPALREFFTETAPLQIGAADVSYVFEYPLIFVNEGPGIPLGPITIASISEQQYLVGAAPNSIYEFSETATLVLQASSVDVATTNRIESFSTTVALEIAASETVALTHARQTTGNLEISASEVVNKKFVYIDSLSLSISSTAVLRSKHVTSATTGIRLDANVVVKNRFVIADSTAFSVSANLSTQKIRYATVSNTDTFALDDDSTHYNVFKPYQGYKFRKTLTVNRTFTVGDNQTQYNIEFAANNLSAAELAELAAELTLAVDRSGYVLRNQNLFLSFWKNGIPQFAIRQLNTGSASNPTRYIFNKPRFTNTYNQNTNVGTITWDTNPQSTFFTPITSTFAGIVYNRTTETDFQFDEVRMYSGDVANTSSLLLWTAGLPYPIAEFSGSDSFEISPLYSETGGFEIGETHLNEITYNYDDTAEFSQLAGESIEVKFDYETIVFNSFTIVDEIDVVYIDVSETDLEINETHDTQIIYNYIDDAELEVNETSEIEITYTYDDTADFVKFVVESIEVSLDFDTVIFNTFAADANIEATYNFSDSIELEITETPAVQLIYDYDDTADFVKFVVESIEITSDIDTVLFNTFAANETIEATYNFSDSTELEVNSDSINILSYNVVDTGNLEFNSDESLEIIYNYDDTANFANFVVESIEVISDFETVLFNTFAADADIDAIYSIIDSADLEINAAQAIGITETSQAELTLDSPSTQSIVYDFEDSAGFVKFVATSQEITITSTDSASLEISAFSEQNIIYDIKDISGFVKFVVSDSEVSINVVDDVDLLINAEDIVTKAFNISSTASLNIDAEDLISRVYKQPSIGFSEIKGYSFAKGYTLFTQEYIDDTILLKLDIESIEETTKQETKQIWIG